MKTENIVGTVIGVLVLLWLVKVAMRLVAGTLHTLVSIAVLAVIVLLVLQLANAVRRH